jgi:hypothetical protein
VRPRGVRQAAGRDPVVLAVQGGDVLLQGVPDQGVKAGHKREYTPAPQAAPRAAAGPVFGG